MTAELISFNIDFGIWILTLAVGYLIGRQYKSKEDTIETIVETKIQQALNKKVPVLVPGGMQMPPQMGMNPGVSIPQQPSNKKPAYVG